MLLAHDDNVKHVVEACCSFSSTPCCTLRVDKEGVLMEAGVLACGVRCTSDNVQNVLSHVQFCIVCNLQNQG